MRVGFCRSTQKTEEYRPDREGGVPGPLAIGGDQPDSSSAKASSSAVSSASISSSVMVGVPSPA